jgi:hypothetical protein
MRRSVLTFGVGLGALALGLVGGCSTGPQRHEVTGTVLFQGQPLDEGIIDFEPLDGQGSKSGASITNGQYKIPQDKGLFAGRYRVSIVGGGGPAAPANPDEPPGPDAPKPAHTPGGKDRIPAEFNTKSKLVKEVTEAGPNKIDFAIP